jgi:hypothetical protein
MGVISVVHSLEGDHSMKRLFLTVALIGSAAAAQAQPMSQPYSATPSGPDPARSSGPLDPYGHRFVGADNWQRSPGDPVPSASTPFGGQAPSIASQPPATAQAGPHQPAIRDEFGFRYDAQGNRIDAHGNIISPHTKTP